VLTIGGSVLFDLLLEPAAIALGYWQWQNNQIPLQNYLSWGALAAIAAMLYQAMKCHHEERLPAYYLLLMLNYFAILSFVLSRLQPD
jgi:putative membrane protein